MLNSRFSILIRRELQRFHNYCDSLPAANTGRCYTIPLVPPFQFIKQGHCQTRPGSTQRMSERDRATVDIDFIAVEFERSLARNVLPGKSFIDFHEIQIGKL